MANGPHARIGRDFATARSEACPSVRCDGIIAFTSGDGTIANLPTFIRTAYDQYVSRRELPDYYGRYKALESVYATLVKYVGTTFALIAADQDSDLKDDAWGKIFDSSGLGGWLDAIDVVCSRMRTMPDAVREYCDDYTNYKAHPYRKSLDKVADHLGVVVDELATRGYRMERPKSLNIRRALRYAVTVRNKCAHGALDELFFSRTEADLVKMLKLLLRLVPLSQFVFWGQFGGNAVEFLEYPPRQRARRRECHFWAESDLLSGGFAERIPFLLYRQDSRAIYLLNDKATEDSPSAEYIDYVTGQVVYRAVEHSWPRSRSHVHKSITSERYADYAAVLSNDTLAPLAWREVPMRRATVDASTKESGIYIFTATVNLGGRSTDVVLYVGKTTNLGERLASYLRIWKGYDDSRPAISDMFSTYRDVLKLLFAPVAATRLALLERAIYETTIPAYNRIAPTVDG